jgi:hypothetical protein
MLTAWVAKNLTSDADIYPPKGELFPVGPVMYQTD